LNQMDVFCGEYETSDHLFFQCVSFWTDVHDWLHTGIRLQPFFLKDIVYGVIRSNSEWDFLVNNILFFGKYFLIHKCKYLNVKPRFFVCHKDFISFTKALNIIESRN